ncbi:MAG: DEAD/DEAH box helicase [Euryarchaeota archaeon]|nr:DEAD/DEAH box helicase [Euryarchaeota archaeon]
MFTNTRFTDWDLPEGVIKGIDDLGWEFSTPVQKDTIPLALSGRDVIGQARTGSGKTAAFGIPIINKCEATGKLQALVLTPTRELANQVAEEINSLQGDCGLTILTVYGGTDLEKQAKTLQDGVDIIVGTPGRVMDMTERGHIELENATTFCLDEADRMLDMGFFPDIMWVVEKMTSRQQTLLFSATFPQEIIDAANEFMNEPEFVLTNVEELDIPPIEMYMVHIGRANKLWVTGRLLAQTGDEGQTIIFCNTKRMVDLAVQRLSKHGFDVAGLHGDLNQNQREKVLGKFKDGQFNTIIATDVAARGLDVDGITMVINYDIPNDTDSFIHRIGRTGRIGRKGEAWSLVSRDDSAQLNKIIATYGLNIIESETPELPEGMDRDPVKKQDDYGETANVFGFVTLSLDIPQSAAGSSRTVSNWFIKALNCKELEIGDVSFEQQKTLISIHTSKVGLAIKALEKREMAGQIVSASIV